MWLDSWPLTFTNWAVNEPSGERCVKFTNAPGWEADDCDVKLPYMCKFTLGKEDTDHIDQESTHREYICYRFAYGTGEGNLISINGLYGDVPLKWVPNYPRGIIMMTLFQCNNWYEN